MIKLIVDERQTPKSHREGRFASPTPLSPRHRVFHWHSTQKGLFLITETASQPSMSFPFERTFTLRWLWRSKKSLKTFTSSARLAATSARAFFPSFLSIETCCDVQFALKSFASSLPPRQTRINILSDASGYLTLLSHFTNSAPRMIKKIYA